MDKTAVILLAEDDEGHAFLIERNLRRTGLENEIVIFSDGQKVLDFLIGDRKREKGNHLPTLNYILLLDIKMPKVDGVEVLRRIKQNEDLRKLPIIMLTTTDNQKEIDLCHSLGCSFFITKPVNFEKFSSHIMQLGHFLRIVQFPELMSDD